MGYSKKPLMSFHNLFGIITQNSDSQPPVRISVAVTLKCNYFLMKRICYVIRKIHLLTNFDDDFYYKRLRARRLKFDVLQGHHFGRIFTSFVNKKKIVFSKILNKQLEETFLK